MALIHKACWSLLAALPIVAVVACGRQAAPSAPYQKAAATEPAQLKVGEPVGVLPSRVVPGDVATFDASATSGGRKKDRDTAGSLPSHLAEGKGAAYAPRGPAAAGGVEAAAGQD